MRAGAQTASGAAAEAHPVQGLVCVHGYSDPLRHLLPVDGVFLALGASSVMAEVWRAPNGVRGEAAIEVESDPLLRAAEAARVRAFVELAEPLLGAPEIGAMRISHEMGIGFGMGSSGAVFAALTCALSALGGRAEAEGGQLADVARLGSYSAAASLRGGLVRVGRGGEAVRLSLPASWALESLVIPVAPRARSKEKESRRIHRDVVTSPYYRAWLDLAARASSEVGDAVASGDLHAFQDAIDTYVLHNLAVLVSGAEAYVAWEADTLRWFHYLRDLRADTGADFGLSVNSGPSVFAFGPAEVIEWLARRIDADAPGTLHIRSKPGGGAHAISVPVPAGGRE
jgi:mevalonate pyrophosphate decarboxylase